MPEHATKPVQWIADSTDSPISAGRPWKRGLLWLLFLGPFFFASYGFAAWLSGQRADVGVIVFDWERHIPFLPWTIVPYWSIDLFYGLSLVLLATRRELDTHARRLLAAQLIAVACFVLFPLRFSFERPVTAGAFGWLFDVLSGFDQPFNQAPSLHVALLVILWAAYLRVVPRAWRWVVHATGALIGISVLTTWQHHFFDVPTGLWLGWMCVWLFPFEGRSPLACARAAREPATMRLALMYGLGAVAATLLAVRAGGAWLWLLWPANALMLVALIYAALGETAFQKHRDGAFSPASRWLLAPYLRAAWVSSRWWTRSLAQADLIVPGVLIGRMPTARERERLGAAAIVDVSAELPCRSGAAFYVCVPMLDLLPPRSEQIELAAAAIDEARKAGTVLVCCALGFSRSAVAVAAWLLRSGAAGSLEAAVALVRRSRPAVVLGPGHIAALREWQRRFPC